MIANPSRRRGERRRLRFFEQLEDRRVMAASMQVGDIGYIVDDNAPGLLRYDIANETWLSPITLADATQQPTAILVDAEGIYASFDTAVERFNLDGTGREHLLYLPNPVSNIHSDGNLLFFNYSVWGDAHSRFVSFDKTSQSVLDTTETEFDRVADSALAPESNRIFGYTVPPSATNRPVRTSLTYDDQGNFLSSARGENIEETDYMLRTGVFPDESRVFDRHSGSIYDATTLQFVDSFNVPITDIAFVDGQAPIVLSGNDLYTYNQDLLPLAVHDLPYDPGLIFLNDTNLITLKRVHSSNPTQFTARTIPLTELAAPQPGEPLDPNGLAYAPHSVDVGPDGVVHITSRTSKSIFSWDPVLQVYGETVPLRGIPKQTAFSPETNTEYLLYRTGLITKVDFNAAEPREELFTKIIGPADTHGIAVAGKYLVASGYNQPEYFNKASSYTVSPEGEVGGTIGHGVTSSTWSDVHQKLFLMNSYNVASLEVNASGDAYPDVPAGSFGDWQVADNPHFDKGPLYLSGDHGLFLSGSQRIFDAQTLLPQGEISTTFVDAAWLENELYTTRTISAGAQVQHWTAGVYQADELFEMPGTAIALEAVAPDRLLAISRDGAAAPVLQLLDGALKPVLLDNHAPVLDTSLSPQLPTLREDTASPGSRLVADLLRGAVSDADADALRGIAVTSASDFRGQWEYTVNGGQSWESMDTPTQSAARLLPGWARVRFTPQPDFHGVVKLYYRAWDQTQGSVGGTYDLVGNTGGNSAFSDGLESASLTVTPVNDKPTLSFSEPTNYVRDRPAILLAPYAKVSDVDDVDFGGGFLRVRISDGADASNRLSLGSTFTVDAQSNVWKGTLLVGKRVSSGWGTRELRITFAAGLSEPLVQDLVRAVSFKTVDGAAGMRKALFSLSDGNGGVSDEVVKSVNVT